LYGLPFLAAAFLGAALGLVAASFAIMDLYGNKIKVVEVSRVSNEWSKLIFQGARRRII
jgi:hypothetical protein